MKTDYLLMWKDFPVIRFNTHDKSTECLHPTMLPISIKGQVVSWDSIRSFCASRILQNNREYFKEILTSCCIDDQSDVNVCIISRGLSFRDNYWIKQADSLETWKNVNLYNNPFSTDISYTALTGETCSVHIGDSLFTGELTGKGTRAKCFIRRDSSIYLAKSESLKEISAEVASSFLAYEMQLPSAKYTAAKQFGRNCSLCRLYTSENRELIHGRDYISYFNEEIQADSKTYLYFHNIDPINFIKMQLFDYITLNTDRNRDNMGIERVAGKEKGLYPVYDHDSCFKGVSENAHYFVTGRTFSETISYLKASFPQEMKCIRPDIERLLAYIDNDGKEMLKKLHLDDKIDGVKERIEKILDTQPEKKFSFSGEVAKFMDEDDTGKDDNIEKENEHSPSLI